MCSISVNINIHVHFNFTGYSFSPPITDKNPGGKNAPHFVTSIHDSHTLSLERVIAMEYFPLNMADEELN